MDEYILNKSLENINHLTSEIEKESNIVLNNAK